MKLRGALGGLNLLIEASDTPGSVAQALAERAGMLTQKVTVELAADADADVLEAVFMAVRKAGGELGRVRGARGAQGSAQDSAGRDRPTAERGGGTGSGTGSEAVAQAPAAVVRTQALTADLPEGARTVIVQHNLRAGFRGEYRGSVVVLGDVNPGAELIAAGDVIVMGALRGVVHAGAGGRTDAIVYARPIASAQIRIADAVARSADDNSLGAMRRMQEHPEAELARLQDGAIQIESYQPQRS